MFTVILLSIYKVISIFHYYLRTCNSNALVPFHIVPPNYYIILKTINREKPHKFSCMSEPIAQRVSSLQNFFANCMMVHLSLSLADCPANPVC